MAGTRARLADTSVTVDARQIELTSVDDVRRGLAELAPAVVLNCVSHHSPWERPSEWMKLVRRAGFAITLPLQAQPAMTVARAAAELDPAPLVVNACFPDLVNPLLAALGLPVLCGAGNVAVLAASVRAALDLEPLRDLRMLAHHVHLHAPAGPDDEARVWLDGKAVDDVTALLARQRATPRSELNHVTGYTTALLVQHLLTGGDLRANLPGPLGLPGGYPVLLRDGALELDLPDGLDEGAAVAWNQRAALADGGRIDGDRVEFAPRAAQALEPHLPDLAAGFPVAEVTSVLDRIVELRDRLRTS
ncbi:hypothetical protein [Actinophytocola sp.]|uniref:hypothetical protein n=1 Tax=Actinophytocola sp. TaxID=1872138 RepID=UPI003D6A8ACD